MYIHKRKYVAVNYIHTYTQYLLITLSINSVIIVSAIYVYIGASHTCK